MHRIARGRGEEFLLVLNGCAQADLNLRAGKVRQAIADTSFWTEKGPISLSLSIGVIAIEN